MLVVAFSTTAFSQSYSWVRKQTGSSLGFPIAADKYNSDHIYYGSNATIYKSYDRGESFSTWGTAIPGSYSVKTMLTTAKDRDVMIVAVEGSGTTNDKIVKTTDAGQTWTTTLGGLTFSYFGIPMTPDHNHPDTIYTMSNHTFYKSTDFGSTWSVVSNPTQFDAPCDIEVFPDSSHIILVGDNTSGIFRSTDYGVTWTLSYYTSGEIPTIFIDKRTHTAWATKWGGGGGLLKSTDFGQTWTLYTYFQGKNMWGVSVAPENSDFIMAGEYSGSRIYISKDGGQNWIVTTLSASNYCIAIFDSLTIFAAQSPGIFKANVPYVPVELSSFYATVIDQEVSLGWSTATELNNARFEIERTLKGDPDGWIKIGEIEGHGTTTSPKRYLYTDRPGVTGTYLYRLKQVDYDGSFEYSNEIEVTTELPKVFSLSQNYPNPFNPSTNFAFTLPEQSEVTLSVFNITGEEVAKVIDSKVLPAGNHSLEFNASNLNSGVYLYRLSAGGKSITKKFTLLK